MESYKDMQVFVQGTTEIDAFRYRVLAVQKKKRYRVLALMYPHYDDAFKLDPFGIIIV